MEEVRRQEEEGGEVMEVMGHLGLKIVVDTWTFWNLALIFS